MAIYTIEINERTNKGKALRTLLENEDVVTLKPITGADLLLKEIATGLQEVKKIQEGKLPKRTVSQMVNDL
jgi:hypothetical protein